MGNNKPQAHHTSHVFSYTPCVDLTQLPSQIWRKIEIIYRMKIPLAEVHNEKYPTKKTAHYLFIFRRFWVKEPLSFRKHFRQKKVYLNSSIVARASSRVNLSLRCHKPPCGAGQLVEVAPNAPPECFFRSGTESLGRVAQNPAVHQRVLPRRDLDRHATLLLNSCLCPQKLFAGPGAYVRTCAEHTYLESSSICVIRSWRNTII